MTRKQHTYKLIPTQNLGSSLVKNLIAKNEYDQLGQLVTKKVGGSANNATDRWQEINYNYNVRGWLTRINDIGLTMAGRGLPPPSPSDDLFSFAIQYNQLIEPGSGDYTSPLYNGNIAQTFWKTASDNTLRGYNYDYDELNRLLNAEFYKKGTNPYSNAYKESLAYDLNGNITSLYRTTADAHNNAIQMDNLTYAYENGNGNSNRLMNVNDAVSTQNTDGFVDGNTSLSLDDYEYDSNGNMILDRNKGIESIHYNHLNLPTRVNFTNNKHISYKYNAAGQKLQKTVNYIDSIKIVDYLDGFQYAGEVLQFFPHPEGYVKVTALSAGRGLPTSDFAFNYVFNYTDHLGNVRLSYTKDPQTGTLEILDENHYYPFGLKHGVYAAGNLKDFTLNGAIDTPILEQVRKTEYNYKYNGKELQDELGLNVYAYGWRDYDPATARFNKIDRFAERYNPISPYSYANNNPVLFIDIMGDSIGLGRNHYDKFKNDVEGKISDIENNRTNRIAKLTDKGKTGKADKLKAQWAKEDADGTSNLSVYRETLSELNALESSSQIYDLFVGVSDPTGNGNAGGFLGYDESRNSVTVNLMGGYDSGFFSHELKHAYQYETGAMSIMVWGSGKQTGGDLYDLQDEVEAYKRQTYFGKPGMSLSEIKNNYPAISTRTSQITLKTYKQAISTGGSFRDSSGNKVVYKQYYNGN